MGCLGALGILFSLILQIADQASDVFIALLFYLEGNVFCALATLGIVFLPGLVIAYIEVRGVCSGRGSFVKAVGYLLLSPLWSIILHFYSFCDVRYVRRALFFKTTEGFLEAGPQLVLQLSLLFKGILTHSSKMALSPILNGTLAIHIDADDSDANSTLEILGRVYDNEARYWFGWIHILGVVLSFISIFTTTIFFNEVEENRRNFKFAFGKLIFGIPFFFFTLLYRSIGMGLLICFLQYWSSIIIFTLFFINVLAALAIGDDFGRSTAYGLWSLFVPVGYSRDPYVPLGYKMVDEQMELELELEGAARITMKDIERSQNRTKYFLTFHVLSSIFILGSSLIIMMIMILTYPEYYELNAQAIFSLDLLSILFLPLLGLSLGFSVLLVRPYHRVDCSGGEVPSGNAIV